MSQHPIRRPVPLVFSILLSGWLVAGCGGDKGGNAGNGGSGGNSGSSNSDRAGSGGSGDSSRGSSSGGGGESSSGGGSGESSSGGSGGSSSGGSGGSGPGSSGGSGGGAGPAAMGPAVLKFCNALSLANMEKIDLTLEVGTDPVRLVATSGECAPVTKQACTPAKEGMGPLRLLHEGDVLFEAETNVPSAGEFMLLATLDPATMQPLIEVYAFQPEAKCSDFDFSTVIDTDGGAGGASDAGGGGGGGMTRPPPRFFPAPPGKSVFESPFRQLKADPRVTPIDL